MNSWNARVGRGTVADVYPARLMSPEEMSEVLSRRLDLPETIRGHVLALEMNQEAWELLHSGTPWAARLLRHDSAAGYSYIIVAVEIGAHQVRALLSLHDSKTSRLVASLPTRELQIAASTAAGTKAVVLRWRVSLIRGLQPFKAGALAGIAHLIDIAEVTAMLCDPEAVAPFSPGNQVTGVSVCPVLPVVTGVADGVPPVLH